MDLEDIEHIAETLKDILKSESREFSATSK
jgi:hypothetical protein